MAQYLENLRTTARLEPSLGAGRPRDHYIREQAVAETGAQLTKDGELLQCCLPGSRIRVSCSSRTRRWPPVGDGKVPHNQWLHLGVVFPQETGVQPMYMYFSRASENESYSTLRAQPQASALIRAALWVPLSA